jgi:hypothetical protein
VGIERGVMSLATGAVDDHTHLEAPWV